MSKEKYYVTLDTETTNDLDYPLVYDLGFAFHNRKGKVVAKFSFVIYEVFFGMKDLMKEAFYAEKDLNRNIHEVLTVDGEIKKILED